jgi:ABC-type nitrate/sulfonate/bicarbonate transport system substrate-binding protein
VYQITHNVNMLDHYIAADQGFYRKHGLEVETLVGTERPSVNPARLLVDGEVDFAMAGAQIFTTAAQQGFPLKYVLYTRRDPPHRLVGRPSIKAAGDLRGKLIGVSPGGGLYYQLIRQWLRENGLDPDRDVRFLDRNPSVLADFHVAESRWAREAYASSADAFVIFEIARDLYRALGFNELVETYERYPGSSTHGIATTQELIDEYPDLVERMVLAHIDVARFIQTDPPATISYMAERWNVAEAVAASCYERMRSVFIADVSAEHLERELAMMRSMEEMPPLPEIRPTDLIEPRFAEAALATTARSGERS